MDKYIPTFTDVSEWDVKIYENTTGTRSKQIVIQPASDKEFFFKGSKELDTGEIRYPMEFWSEIASSKVGQFLGFPLLDYNIAYSEHTIQKVGCISASMVDDTKNNLTEGVVYLTGKKPSYNPETDKKDYTFQFILDTLKLFKLEKHLVKFLEMLVFDALIGNSDRHQENWGIITYYNEILNEIEINLKKSETNYLKKQLIKLTRYFIKSIPNQLRFLKPNSRFRKNALMAQSEIIKNEFSPIYDSGCCLGREFVDEKVVKMLSDNQMLDKYLRKGMSEIHWEGLEGKLNHFELLEKLQVDYRFDIKRVISRVVSEFDENSISYIILNLDKNLPEKLNDYKLSEDRKNLMIKLITLRYNKLASLI
ncbi:hypothetical protein [Winogradskyella pulchriflava]|uniref:HipA-like C-terminal domain-containing protein n=1 Tax=Winogradskyella pulchriflava TaxID=1110688 RepID=A0ABV6Q9L4_9FLAO